MATPSQPSRELSSTYTVPERASREEVAVSRPLTVWGTRSADYRPPMPR
jgi:hypothetical protein